MAFSHPPPSFSRFLIFLILQGGEMVDSAVHRVEGGDGRGMHTYSCRLPVQLVRNIRQFPTFWCKYSKRNFYSMPSQ